VPLDTLRGTYNYRRLHVLIGAGVALAFGGFALRYVVSGLYHTAWSLGDLCSALFVVSIGAVLVVCCLVLLRRWFCRSSMVLEISDAGIRYGKTFQPWTAIRWVCGKSKRGGIQLFYQTNERGMAGCDRPLPIGQGLTPSDYDGLMRSLDESVRVQYPHVTFGQTSNSMRTFLSDPCPHFLRFLRSSFFK